MELRPPQDQRLRDRVAVVTGEDVPAFEYYLRGQPMFETGSEKYDWLNRIVAVSVGKQEAMGVTYDVFRIL